MSDSVMTIDKWGTKRWWNLKGQFHRTDGPAVDWINGGKAWYQNGKLHRLDGPAVEYPNSYKAWHVNGKWLGLNVKGFWNLWDKLTPEQKKDPVLLSFLPVDFNV